MLAGQGAALLLQAAYFVLMGRALGSREYGMFAGVVALIGVMSQFSSLGMEMILVRNVSRNASSFAVTWGNALVIACTGFLLLLGASVAFAHWFLAPALRLLVPFIALSDGLLGKVVQLASRAFQGAGRLAMTARLTTLTYGTRLVAAIGLYLEAHAHARHASAVEWAHIYWLSSLAAAMAAVVLVTVRLGWPRLRLPRARDLSEGFSFSLSSSSISIYNDIDKTFLDALGQSAAAGIYAAAYRVVDVAASPVYSLYAAATPRLFRDGARGVEQVLPLTRRLLARSVLYGAGAAVALYAGAPVLPRVFGPSFAESANALRWLCLLPVLRALHYGWGTAITASASQWNRTATQFGAAAFNLMLDFALIPRWSWRGAAVASLLTDGMLALLSLLVLQRVKSRSSRRVQAALSEGLPAQPQGPSLTLR